MLMFHFDLIFLLVLAVFAGGMVLLHFAATPAGSRLLKIAGIVLVVGSVMSAVCVTYYGVKYWRQGAYAVAHGSMSGPMMMHHMQDMMGKSGMMGSGMMKQEGEHSRDPGPCGAQPGMPPCEDMAPTDTSVPEDHEQHH